MLRRALIGISVGLIVAAATFGVHAQRGRRGSAGGSAPRAAARPSNYSAALAGDMQQIQWGWNRERLIRHFRDQVREQYRDPIARAPGAIEEDRLRAEMNNRIRLISQSFFQFDGTTSGYDSSFLREEFTHNNGEAMLKVVSDTSEDYYFFIQDHLWKWYRAFHTRTFAGVDFDGFAQALQERYGPAERRSGPLYEGGREMQWIEWQDEHTRARAIDNTAGYGFFCLVFEDKGTLSRLDQLRVNRRPRGERRNAFVDAVTGGDPNAELVDPNADVVHRITGAADAGVRDAGRAADAGVPDAGTRR